MRIAELSQRLKRLSAKRDNGAAIKVQLSSGDAVEISPSQIMAFGANALFIESSAERSVVRDSVSHIEENGRMYELLEMVLCSEDVLPTS
jgi:hypothetical protein